MARRVGAAQPRAELAREVAAIAVAVGLATLTAACRQDEPVRARTLDLGSNRLRTECDGRQTEWRRLRSGSLARYGLRQRPGERCAFDLDVPPRTGLAFRVEARGLRDGVRVVVAASRDGAKEILFDAVLDAGEVHETRIPLRPGPSRISLASHASGDTPGARARVDWTDAVLTTRTRDVESPWALPADEALAPWLAGKSPGPDRRRLLVIGIDGGTWALLEPLLARGELPHLAALRDRGRWGVLESTPVPESAMAWTSMRTGVGPGVHGVYTFHSAATSRRSWWHLLGDRGLTSILIAVPKASVARPLRGILIGGWTHGRDRAYVQPADLQPHLDRAGHDPALAYLRNPATWRARMALRTDIAIALLERHPWDHAFVVYEYGDTVGHLFGLDAPQWAEVQRDVDAAVGRLLAHVPEETTVLVVSDHGWERYPRWVNVGAWLRGNGHANLKAGPPASGRVISVASAAAGGSEPDAEQVARLREGLLALEHPAGGHAIERVDRAASLFPGSIPPPVTLVVRAGPGHRASLPSRADRVFGSGSVDHHGRDGLYLLAGPGIAPGPGPRASIYDVAPTVLAHFGVPAPPDAEGASLHDFGIASRPGGPGRLVFEDPPDRPAPVSDPDLDARLRALGYIE